MANIATAEQKVPAIAAKPRMKRSCVRGRRAPQSLETDGLKRRSTLLAHANVESLVGGASDTRLAHIYQSPRVRALESLRHSSQSITLTCSAVPTSARTLEQPRAGKRCPSTPPRRRTRRAEARERGATPPEEPRHLPRSNPGWLEEGRRWRAGEAETRAVETSYS